MKMSDIIYTVEVEELVGAGDLSHTIDILYFKNKNDAEKVLNYQDCMDIPYTNNSIKEVEYDCIPRGAEIIENVLWDDKGEALYNLSLNFKHRADSFYWKYPNYAPEYYKKYFK